VPGVGRVMRHARRILLATAIVVVLAGAVPVSHFAAARTEPVNYLLPWAAGEANRHSVLQGVYIVDADGACSSGCATHGDDGQHFAWDFDLPEGTDVLAARGGTVGLVADSWPAGHCGGLTPIDNPPPGYLVSPVMGNQGNLVRIDHGDGTSALYLHLSEVSDGIAAKARTGGRVVQGEVLGRSGRTGLTQCRPHLHFQVETTVRADWFTESLPIAFADRDVIAQAPDGVPVEGASYVSDNVPVGADG